MIYEVQGDILLTKAQALVHGIAANDPMSQGLAMSLHKNYPAMHKYFHHYCQTQHPKTGDAWAWGGAEKVRNINLITQEGGYDHGSRPGKATIKSVSDCLKSLVKAHFNFSATPRNWCRRPRLGRSGTRHPTTIRSIRYSGVCVRGVSQRPAS